VPSSLSARTGRIARPSEGCRVGSKSRRKRLKSLKTAMGIAPEGGRKSARMKPGRRLSSDAAKPQGRLLRIILVSEPPCMGFSRTLWRHSHVPPAEPRQHALGFAPGASRPRRPARAARPLRPSGSELRSCPRPHCPCGSVKERAFPGRQLRGELRRSGTAASGHPARSISAIAARGLRTLKPLMT